MKNIKTDLFKNLVKNPPAWWNAIKEDREIYVEIRKEKYIDAYFNGGAVIKELKWSAAKGYSARIHARYLSDTDRSVYVACPLEELPDLLPEIKRRIRKYYPDDSEKGIQANLILKEGVYIDSELQWIFTGKEGKRKSIRIDLVKADFRSHRIVFRELKRMADGRLLKIGETRNHRELNEIKDQMLLYTEFISEYHDTLISYYNKIISLKIQLGLLPWKLQLTGEGRYVSEIVWTPELLIADYKEPYTEESKKGKRVKACIEQLNREGIPYSFVHIQADGYLYKRHLQAITKREWDLVFEMIPWLEEIEKTDPEKQITDHSGKRTRSLKEAKYKTAAVQLTGRLTGICMPFNRETLQEVAAMSDKQEVEALSTVDLCKLLTFLLYYKKGKVIPVNGLVACVGEDLKDGKVLKILKALEKRVRKDFEKERIKYNAYNPYDTDFAGYARLLQSRWREEKGYPIGKSDRGKEYGNYVDTAFAIEKKVNFLTENIRNLVVSEIRKSAERKALISEPRIWNNLLSSQPLCFNLFGELSLDLELATVFFRKMFPERVDTVTAVLFEYSPCRGNKDFTGDHSAFDVFVEFTREGRKGCIGIEVKSLPNPPLEPDIVNLYGLSYENVVHSKVGMSNLIFPSLK